MASTSPGRDRGVDVAKGFLVVGMTYSHTVRLLAQEMSPFERQVSFLVNLITFPSFVLLFGFAAYHAYLGQPRAQVGRRIWVAASKTLLAFYISGLAYRAMVDDHPFRLRTVAAVALWFDVPQYSEFLLAFALLALLTWVCFEPLKRLVAWRWGVAVVAAVGLLATVAVPYRLVPEGPLRLLVGASTGAFFPIVHYAGFYVGGMWLARHAPPFRWRLLAVGAALVLPFVIVELVTGSRPTRFPVSAAWLLASTAAAGGCYFLGRPLARLGWVADWLDLLGRNALVALVLGNLMLFGLAARYHDRLSGMVVPFLVAAAVLASITLIVGWVRPPRRDSRIA